MSNKAPTTREVADVPPSMGSAAQGSIGSASCVSSPSRPSVGKRAIQIADLITKGVAVLGEWTRCNWQIDMFTGFGQSMEKFQWACDPDNASHPEAELTKETSHNRAAAYLKASLQSVEGDHSLVEDTAMLERCKALRELNRLWAGLSSAGQGDRISSKNDSELFEAVMRYTTAVHARELSTPSKQESRQKSKLSYIPSLVTCGVLGAGAALVGHKLWEDYGGSQW